MSINRVVISGNLTRDPEFRTTASGMDVVSFGIAVNDRRRNQQTGEWEDYANFVNCTWFGNRARSFSQYLHKGSHVALSGRLRWSQWQDKQTGANRNKLEVVVDDLDNLTPRDSGGAYNSGSQSQAQSAPSAPSAPATQAAATPVVPAVDGSLYDEDIPF